MTMRCFRKNQSNRHHRHRSQPSPSPNQPLPPSEPSPSPCESLTSMSTETTTSLSKTLSKGEILSFGEAPAVFLAQRSAVKKMIGSRLLLIAGSGKYGSAERAFYEQVRGELGSPGEKLKADIERLCSMFSVSKPTWKVNYENSSNEVHVDFN